MVHSCNLSIFGLSGARGLERAGGSHSFPGAELSVSFACHQMPVEQICDDLWHALDVLLLLRELKGSGCALIATA